MSTERLKVLFVDDEERLLDGLRRLLRPLQNEWDVSFATSGAQALTLLEAAPCDIVVTDLRMPGMSGKDLQLKVRELYPDTIRFMLTGQSESDEFIKDLGPIHQFLQKPCDPTTLKNAIARVCRCRSRMRSSPARSVMSYLESIPVLQGNIRDLLAELDDENASAESIGRIISRDIGMTAKIMHLVNSSFFASTKRVSTPAEAVARLGLRTIRLIAFSLDLFGKLTPPRNSGMQCDALWARAASVATSSRSIAGAAGLPEARLDAAYLAGLLHEIGRLVLGCKLEAEYAAIRAAARKGSRPVADEEEDRLGFRQGELGGYLLGIWGFDDDVVDAVTFFEAPHESLVAEASVLTALHVAVATSASPDGDGVPVDRTYLDRIGWDASKLTVVTMAKAA